MDIYNRCRDKEEITIYDKQNLDVLYDLYSGPLEGNSFIHNVYELIKQYKTI